MRKKEFNMINKANKINNNSINNKSNSKIKKQNKIRLLRDKIVKMMVVEVI